MGDIAREVLVSLAAENLFCKDSHSKKCLDVVGSLSTRAVATVEA